MDCIQVSIFLPKLLSSLSTFLFIQPTKDAEQGGDGDAEEAV